MMDISAWDRLLLRGGICGDIYMDTGILPHIGREILTLEGEALK